MNDTEYWVRLLDELRNPDSASWAAHTLSVGLGRGARLERTNLGQVLEYLPREQIVQATVQAYENEAAKRFCDLILWYFEPQEVFRAYQALSRPHPRVTQGISDYLKAVESPLVKKMD